MNGIRRKTEIAANIATFAVAIIVGVILVNRHFFTTKSTPLPTVPIGTKISIPNIDWSKNKQTLVLALKEGCKFCTESSPFYQRLITNVASKNIQLVAVFPHSVETGGKYLEELKISISNLRHIPFDTIGVSGTPTLLLVNNEGEVTAGWIGRLPEEKESEVLNSLK